MVLYQSLNVKVVEPCFRFYLARSIRQLFVGGLWFVNIDRNITQRFGF